MNSPISRIKATGESIWPAIASSTAFNSDPTASATRSFNRASSGVGAFTIVALGGSTNDDAVLHLDLRSSGQIVDVDDREFVTDLAHLPTRDLLVELPEHLARDGVDDADLVPTYAHDAAGPNAVTTSHVADESAGVPLGHVSAGGVWGAAQ